MAYADKYALSWLSTGRRQVHSSCAFTAFSNVKITLVACPGITNGFGGALDRGFPRLVKLAPVGASVGMVA